VRDRNKKKKNVFGGGVDGRLPGRGSVVGIKRRTGDSLGTVRSSGLRTVTVSGKKDGFENRPFAKNGRQKPRGKKRGVPRSRGRRT